MRWPWQRRVDPDLRDRLSSLVDDLCQQNAEACQIVAEMRGLAAERRRAPGAPWDGPERRRDRADRG